MPPGFWSVIMSDAVTRYSVPNPINRSSLGSDNDLKKNADGSFTLYFQHASPGPDKEANWLPAPAGPSSHPAQLRAGPGGCGGP